MPQRLVGVFQRGAERMVGQGADLGVRNPPALRGPLEPSLPSTVHSGIDLVTAGE